MRAPTSGVSLSRTLWALISLFIVYGATIPFHFSGDLSQVAAKLHAIPLNPFISPLTGHRVSIPDTVQNVLLFLPFGVFGVLAAPASRRRWTRAVVVTALGAALSLFVEIAQLFTIDRVSSLADVTTNTTGAFLGAIAANTLGRAGARAVRLAERAGLTQNAAFAPLVAASVLVVVAAWEPFDVTLELGSVASKFHALARDVWQAGALTDEGIAVIHYALFGLAISRWLEALRRRHVATWAVAIGAVVAAGLEASQIAIGSRMPGLEDALVRMGGVVIGVVLWAFGAQRLTPAVVVGATAIATAVAAAMQQLSPFQVAAAHRPFGLMPFLGDYEHTTFDALSHVIELILLYSPLGFLCAITSGTRRRALVAALLGSLAIAWPIEYAQGWIVGRYPDVTDVAISLGGAWLGVRSAGLVAATWPWSNSRTIAD